MFRRVLKLTGYVVGALLMVGATIALVAYGKGYSYDFKNHRFVLNGLVIIETAPDNANVLVNGKQVSSDTPYRSTIEAGRYSFEVSKVGFRSWSKSLEVRASEVVFAEYVILFPNQIKVESSNLGHPAQSLVGSPDRKRIAYLSADKSPAVWLLDPDERVTRQLYAARAGETLTSLVWASDNSRVLLTSKLNDKTNYIVLSTGRDVNPQNLTDLFNQDFQQLRFNPANNNEMYWISPQGNLHRLNLSDRTASAILADKVSSFSFGGGRVFYVQATKLGKSLFSLERSGTKQELIQSLAESPSYEILFHRLDERDYLVVVPSQAKTATMYQDIFSKNIEAKVIAKDVDHIKRSPDGRFLVVHNSDTITTFDVKKKRLYDFRSSPKGITSLEWFDDFHLVLVAGGKSLVIEYDGANVTTLESVGSPAYASPDRKALVGLSPKDPTQMTYQLIR